MAKESFLNGLLGKSGAALVITLMVLAAITLLGIASINTTITEIKLSRNEHDIQESFYLAEAVALEAVQRLYDTSRDDLNDHIQLWHHARSEPQEQCDFRKPENWIAEQIDQANAAVSILNAHSFFAAVEWDVAGGASLIVTEPRLYANRIYGLNKRSDSDTLVEIGYYLRY